MSGQGRDGRRTVRFDPRQVRVPMPTQPPGEDFSTSVSACGVISPILVRRAEEGGFELLGGHKRLVAALAAGAESIPATVLAGPLHVQLAVAFNEDHHRKPGHSTVECAHALIRLEEARRAAGLAVTRQAMAQVLNVSPATIQRWVNFGRVYPVDRVNGLAERLGLPRARLQGLSARQARRLQAVGPDDEQALKILREILLPGETRHAEELPGERRGLWATLARWWQATLARVGAWMASMA